MGTQRKEGKAVDIWKKKRWYQLIAPKTFRETVLGETPALEPQLLMGREAKLSLTSVTNDMKKQNISVSFVVQKVQGEKAFTELKSYELAPSFIKRLVRRGRDRIDDTYKIETLDKVKVTIKPFMITSTNVKSSIITLLRKTAATELKRKFENLNYNELVSLLVFGRIHEEVYRMLKRIYPIKNFEIRSMDVLSFENRTEEVQRSKEQEREEQEKAFARKESKKAQDEDAEEEQISEE
jgi:small subunit ribosomal protein S3Ae